LRRRNKLLPGLETKVNKWAWGELTRQLALVQAKSKNQDAFSFAYLLMLVTAGTPTSKISPERSSIQHAALQTVFDCQLGDGSWPLSRPLFHYPKVGNAHCYEYEMLTQLLQEPRLEDLLLQYLPNLFRATESLQGSVYRLDTGVSAWASGHHPQLPGPESWTTASVYHFVHRLDRLLAEAVRRELFRYLDQPLPGTGKRGSKDKKHFAPSPSFLDSKLDLPNKPQYPLRDFLWEKFVQPISEQADSIVSGRKFEKGTPISAIFFGPPGTSKTDLSKKVAEFLAWPLLAIDPSHLLRNGMDGIQAEANAIFRRLEEAERVVVLFDEFDELVRERGSSDADAFSRFLTTAMLPKLASIHKRRTLVFIIATNNIGDFDLAIRRQGRFDRVVQVMPPPYESKMEKQDWGGSKIDIEKKLRALNVNVTGDLKTKIGELTFGECDDFATELASAPNAQKARKILTDHWRKCTLRERVSKAHLSKKGQTTWAERCESESRLSR
jgi:ATPase family associated with various cellular activities (AAA)